jgi:hypothetical protein
MSLKLDINTCNFLKNFDISSFAIAMVAALFLVNNFKQQ